MKILTYNTRRNRIVALVTDEDAYLLELYPDENKTLMDIDGYCNDYDLCAKDIKVTTVEPEEVSTVLKYRYLIESNCDIMFSFLANLQIKADGENWGCI
ncbi:hypothetical protein ADS69_00160 [Enterobacter phage phiEap-3]|uniref:Uncharacterized protein n=1 Tax=Enterobacter phage phiEap-3 TaxID=1682394 RepID=A0A0K2FGT7_9CAUD|nr:hypothetical protein FDI05_gp160 [Enterobacter phage phiEap-3]ALA45265.1 hypothetical protein ADS69_00160 [Enterobacter phage phiEap-3]